MLLIAENAAHEQEIRDAAYVMDTLALKKQLASKEITQQEYAELEYQLKLDYVRKQPKLQLMRWSWNFETKI